MPLDIPVCRLDELASCLGGDFRDHGTQLAAFYRIDLHRLQVHLHGFGEHPQPRQADHSLGQSPEALAWDGQPQDQ